MQHSPNAATVYVGRVSLELPATASISITGADYDGVQITAPDLKSILGDYPTTQAFPQLLDAAWKRHLERIDGNYGPGKPVIVNRDPVEQQRAVLYRLLPAGSPGAADMVIHEVWTVVDGHAIQLSLKSSASDQQSVLPVMVRVMHALGPMTGPIGADVFAAPGCYVHLSPPTGESAVADIDFAPGYSLSVNTDVFKHVHPPDVRARLATGAAPPFGTSQSILAGSVRAAGLDGEQAVVRLQVNGKSAYIAEFGFGGVDGGDPLSPTLSLRLTNDDRTPGLTQQAFMATWRDILAGVTIRGARRR